jgi:hypothetical protein
MPARSGSTRRYGPAADHRNPTHDIGFERDQRNHGVTHKIDPAIDGEREYVNGTLSETGLVVLTRMKRLRIVGTVTARRIVGTVFASPTLVEFGWLSGRAEYSGACEAQPVPLEAGSGLSRMILDV